MVQQALSPRQQSWMRARAKAAHLGVQPHPVFDDHMIYAVDSSAGGWYFIRRNDTSTAYTCSCPAGEDGIPCYHAAAVAGLPEEVERRAAHRAAHADTVNA